MPIRKLKKIFMRQKKVECIALLAALELVLVVIVGGVPTQAEEMPVKIEAIETSSNADFEKWLDALRKEASSAGISDTTLDEALQDVKLAIGVIKRDRSQFEFSETFLHYLRKTVTEDRIERGRQLLLQHQKLLDNIYSQFNVPPRYLIALWGLETNFGDNLGGFPVIDALVTLAYDRRRTNFFRAQLLDALRIIEDGHVNPSAMKGSWAGAMGQMQFMPSTFVQYAIDFSGDGRKDIWKNLPDAFSSAANYLSTMGWKTGQLWGREVLLPDDFDLMLTTMNIKKTVQEWAELGVRRANGSDLPQVTMEGSIVLPQGHKGPAFLVYGNFRIILQWNRSIHYAISVGHLADRIVGLPRIANGIDADDQPLSRHQIEQIQRYLNLLGFEAGSVDGLVGSTTKAAIRAFQAENLIPADGYPSIDLLHLLRAQAAASL